MSKVLVLYDSSHDRIERMAEVEAEGATPGFFAMHKDAGAIIPSRAQ